MSSSTTTPSGSPSSPDSCLPKLPQGKVILVVEYEQALKLVENFLEKAHIEADNAEIRQFFQMLMESYFQRKGRNNVSLDLYEIAGQRADFIEHGPLTELACEIVECIDAITRHHFPQYNALRCGAGIKDANWRGHSALVLHIDGRYFNV